MDLQWELLESRGAYDGFLTIRRDRYRSSDGSVDDWDVIETRDSAAVIAVTTDLASVVLFEQFRVGPARVLREIPGGLVEPGESAVDAAARELREETGHVAAELIDCGWQWAAANSTRRQHLVIAVGCTRAASTSWDAGEMGRVTLLPVGDLLTHLLGGELTDAGGAVRGLLRFALGSAPASPAAADAHALFRAQLA